MMDHFSIPELKMAVHRFQMASNKKSALLKQNMREVAVLLSEDPPKEEKARYDRYHLPFIPSFFLVLYS